MVEIQTITIKLPKQDAERINKAKGIDNIASAIEQAGKNLRFYKTNPVLNRLVNS